MSEKDEPRFPRGFIGIPAEVLRDALHVSELEEEDLGAHRDVVILDEILGEYDSQYRLQDTLKKPTEYYDTRCTHFYKYRENTYRGAVENFKRESSNNSSRELHRELTVRLSHNGFQYYPLPAKIQKV